MLEDTCQIRAFQVSHDLNLIPEAVERIKTARGMAYSKFSGRPISLCQSLERRGELRVKFEEPIYLWPVEYLENQSGIVTSQEQVPIVCVTRDISAHGVGFSYDQRISTDFVVAEFDLFGEGTERLLVETRWSKRVAPHAYVAGGLIIGLVTEVH